MANTPEQVDTILVVLGESLHFQAAFHSPRVLSVKADSHLDFADALQEAKESLKDTKQGTVQNLHIVFKSSSASLFASSSSTNKSSSCLDLCLEAFLPYLQDDNEGEPVTIHILGDALHSVEVQSADVEEIRACLSETLVLENDQAAENGDWTLSARKKTTNKQEAKEKNGQTTNELKKEKGKSNEKKEKETNDADKNAKGSGKEDDDDLVKGMKQLGLESAKVSPPDSLQEVPEASASLRELAQRILEAQHILVLTGAGVSVSAGIPDFRTPGTGLYDNLQKFDLPFPEAVFDLDFYRNNPYPFCTLAQELWPGLKHQPTLTHNFLALLQQKGKLQRCYTQNVDGLEFLASLEEEALVECHGHFRTARCTVCWKPAEDMAVVVEQITVHGKPPVCPSCQGYIKPDIVFFGENLPTRFHKLVRPDTQTADLLLVLGTSLNVSPVNSIPLMVNCPRALLNRELVGDFQPHRNTRQDLFHAGDCDESVTVLCRLLGWEGELKQAKAST